MNLLTRLVLSALALLGVAALATWYLFGGLR